VIITKERRQSQQNTQE